MKTLKEKRESEKEQENLVQVALRVPIELHRQIAESSKDEKRTINNQILYVLENHFAKSAEAVRV